MNPLYLEIAALAIVAAAVLLIAAKLSSTLSLLIEPFRNLSDMQNKVFELQSKAIEAQKDVQKHASDVLTEPLRVLAEIQTKALAIQSQGVEAQKDVQKHASDVFVGPLRALAEIQEKALEIQASGVVAQKEAQKHASDVLTEPLRALGELQAKSLALQAHAIEVQKEAQKYSADILTEPLRALGELQAKAMEVQAVSVEGQKEATATLRMVVQRTLEVSEHADRSARKLSAAHETYRSKVEELDQSREAFVAELAALRETTEQILSSRDQLIQTSALWTGFQAQAQTNHAKTLETLSTLSTQAALTQLQSSTAESFRELLLRDLSRAATRYPRRIKIDLLASVVENIGKVDGGEFLATLRRVKFQLVCEAGDCDHKGNAYLSDGYYELTQASHLVATMRKYTGAPDPGSSSFEGINRFDDEIAKAAAERTELVLHITVKLALANPVAVVTRVPFDDDVSYYMEKLKKGVARAEDVRGFWQIVAGHDFLVRDIGGLAHAQLGKLVESRDESRNLPVYGGLSRVLDPKRGYLWVCPAHAQAFMESVREMGEETALAAKAD